MNNSKIQLLIAQILFCVRPFPVFRNTTTVHHIVRFLQYSESQLNKLTKRLLL